MTYSITPSYQEQMGFGSDEEGEFGGTPIVTAPVVVADDDTQDEDDSPQGLVTKVKDFLSTVFSRDTTAKVVRKPVVTPKSILAQYNLESNPMGGYNIIEYPSSFYEDLIEKEQSKSIFDQDLNYLSSLYTNRRNARFEERFERISELEKKRREVEQVKEPVSNESRSFLSDMSLYREFRDRKRDRELDNIRPRRRPLGLSAKGNLQGLY